MMKPLEVVCAVIIDSEQQFLACKRGSHSSLAGKWEFPGGKTEQGETKETALKREILEELEVNISILRPLESVTHCYPEFEISLSPFLCEINHSEQPKLTEHEEIRWLNISEATPLDWAEADIPILTQIKNLL